MTKAAIDSPRHGSAPRFGACTILISTALLAAAATIGSSLLLKLPLAPAGKAAAALLPALPFILMFVYMARASRRLDELMVRIQFEAVALAFIAVAVIVVTYGQFQKASLAPLANVGFVWVLMAFVYPVCYLLVRRRYN